MLSLLLPLLLSIVTIHASPAPQGPSVPRQPVDAAVHESCTKLPDWQLRYNEVLEIALATDKFLKAYSEESPSKKFPEKARKWVIQGLDTLIGREKRDEPYQWIDTLRGTWPTTGDIAN